MLFVNKLDRISDIHHTNMFFFDIFGMQMYQSDYWLVITVLLELLGMMVTLLPLPSWTWSFNNTHKISSPGENKHKKKLETNTTWLV